MQRKRNAGVSDYLEQTEAKWKIVRFSRNKIVKFEMCFKKNRDTLCYWLSDGKWFTYLYLHFTQYLNIYDCVRITKESLKPQK